MKTIAQILIVWLLIIEPHLGQETDTLQNIEIIQEITTENTIKSEALQEIEDIITENSIKNVELVINQEVTTETVIKPEDVGENSTATTLNVSLNKIFNEKAAVSQIPNQVENQEIKTILKDIIPVTNNQPEINDIFPKPTESLDGETTTTTIVNELNTKPTESLVGETTTTTIVNELNTKPTKSLVGDTTTTTIVNELNTKPTESLVSETTTTTIVNELNTKPTEYPVGDTTATTIVNELNTKPLISLEDYAVKQMNFILDHLLMETQEFVAKVLQATVNTVFQRDYLKRYVEDLNYLLNLDTDRAYSNEVIEKSKAMTRDDLYEEIVNKLNFLKSKPSKYLQRHLPPDWIIEYRNKRSELAIWLDKASEQMHQEFNLYLNEKDDHIKYQYFNEAFDDILQATEIHHKLLLLSDLVKIVNNKKQITFMDLYMQT